MGVTWVVKQYLSPFTHPLLVVGAEEQKKPEEQKPQEHGEELPLPGHGVL
jgi:hypothetical protein